MDLWLVRHGEAVPEREDPTRPLTPEGERAIREVVNAVSGMMGPLDFVAASGKKRAVQTAGIFAEAAGSVTVRSARSTSVQAILAVSPGLIAHQ